MIKIMPEINHHHGHPVVGVIITITLYILAKITVSEIALYLTCMSAFVVILANIPKAIDTIKLYYNKIFRK